METNLDSYQLNNVNRPIYKEGWVCPICGAVMSPNTISCINCKGKMGFTTTCNPLENQTLENYNYLNSSTTKFDEKNSLYTKT